MRIPNGKIRLLLIIIIEPTRNCDPDGLSIDHASDGEYNILNYTNNYLYLLTLIYYIFFGFRES